METTQTVQVALPRNTYLALKRAAEQKRKTENEMLVEAVEAYLKGPAKMDPLVGLFADEPDLIDSIVAEVLDRRADLPLRRGEGANG